MDIRVSYTLLHLEEGFFCVDNTKGEVMGGNGSNLAISRRAFLGAGGAMLLGAACGGNPAATPQGPADAGVVYPTLNPVRVGTVHLPPQQGALDFHKTDLVDIPQTPAPAGILIGDNQATVVSSRDLGGSPAMHGLFRFSVPQANSTLAIELGANNQLYLDSAAVLPDGSMVITADDGFFHHNIYFPFPVEIQEPGVTLFPGASVFTGNGDNGTLWVTVSPYQRYQNRFLAGVVVAYPVNASVIDTEAAEIIPTSSPNPTSIGLRSVGTQQQLLVLNSGDRSVFAKPSVDVIDINAMGVVGGFDLREGVEYQTTPHLAVSEDGAQLFVGTSDESQRVFRVDIDQQSDSAVELQVEGFHSSVVLNGGFVYVTSHDREHSSVTVLDAGDMSPLKKIDLGARAGFSAAYANGIIQLLPHRAVFIEPIEI